MQEQPNITGAHSGPEQELNVRFVNLTPHAINLLKDDGETTIVPPEPTPARVTKTSVRIGRFSGVVGVVSEYGDVTGLPDPMPDTIFIVSGLVRAALPNRKDICSPAELVRDAEGRVIGCKELEFNAP